MPPKVRTLEVFCSQHEKLIHHTLICTDETLAQENIRHEHYDVDNDQRTDSRPLVPIGAKIQIILFAIIISVVDSHPLNLTDLFNLENLDFPKSVVGPAILPF